MNTKREHITFDGRKYPIVKEATGTWRMRSRSKTHPVDIGLGTTDLREAKRVAVKQLEDDAAKRKPRGSETLEDVTKAYLLMPKKCSPLVAEHNVGRLRKIVEFTFGKSLAEYKAADIGPKLWKAYMAKKHGGTLDLNTRRPENEALNSAVKQACSIFIESLRPVYRNEYKITIPDDATVVQWLPTVKAPKPKADVANMDTAIEHLFAFASYFHFCLGLARWAGLRRAEIKACRREWIVEDRGQVYVELHDRPEEGYYTKTGQIYRAMVINPIFAQRLLGIPAGMLVVNPDTTDRDGWFERDPQDWLRPYVGKVKKPLHRLRGLYADDVKRITEDAILARAQAIKEASRNLGHTTTNTTEKSYLTSDGVKIA